jgi:hypothetical protein
MAPDASTRVVLLGLGVGHMSRRRGRGSRCSSCSRSSGDLDRTGVAVIRIDLDGQQVCYSIVLRKVDQLTEPAPGIGSAHPRPPGQRHRG